MSSCSPRCVLAGRNKSLYHIMSRGSDVELLFSDDQQQSAVLPAHSQVLSCWSSVLANAVEAAFSSNSCHAADHICSSDEATGADSSSSSSSSSSNAAADEQQQRKVIPMPGTSRDDWMQVAAFMYPVVPPQQVSWDNLEVLLVLGAKYDMPGVLARAAAFIQSHMCLLDMAEHGVRFVWKWLQLADAAGLDEVCSQCVQRAVQLDRRSCAVQSRLQNLSARALQQLVVSLAAAGPLDSLHSTPRTSYTSSGSYKLYNSPEVANILDLPSP